MHSDAAPLNVSPPTDAAIGTHGDGRAGAPAVHPGAAQTPVNITTPGWRRLLDRTWHAASSAHSSLDAAGIAFFGMWAMFPALAALVGRGGLLFGGTEISDLLSRIRIELPESVGIVVIGQLQAIAAHSRRVSSITLIAGLVLALWSAMRAMRCLIATLNGIYQEDEKRTFWHRQAIVLGFTSFGGFFLLAMLTLIVAVPPWAFTGAQSAGYAFVAAARWPVLVLVLMLCLSVLYRYGPSRPKAQWRWVSGGAFVSGMIWVTGSLLFSYYASHFSRFNPLLGSLGAVTIFFLWAYLTVVTVLLGAQMNAEMERQAALETGTASPKGAA
jgi:membrane protein